MTDPLHDAVISAVERNRMWSGGTSVVVAVSGGQDSLSLLHSLNHLKARWHLSIHVAHFNHLLRGNESDEDSRTVAALADAWNMPVTLGQGDVASAARRTHRSKHEAARDLRHKFLEEVAGKIGASYIALGHTLDDRIETVLLNILRGTGVDGLEGMAHVSGNRVRPLLDVARAETEAYCIRHAIPFRTDPSNVSPVYMRGRLRQELLPTLTSYYNPGVRNALRRLSDLAADDAAFLMVETTNRFARAAANIGSNLVVLSVRVLREEPRSMQRRVIRMAIDRVRGSLHDVDYESVEAVLKWISGSASQSRFQLTLPHGDTIVKGNGETLIVERIAANNSAVKVSQAVAVPGVTKVVPWGIEIVAEELMIDLPVEMEVGSATIPSAVIDGPLIVRSRENGDRMQPFGMRGTRKIQDILVDRKVPRSDRGRVPIIADNSGILWLAGQVVSERIRVTGERLPGIRLQLMPPRASNEARRT